MRKVFGILLYFVLRSILTSKQVFKRFNNESHLVYQIHSNISSQHMAVFQGWCPKMISRKKKARKETKQRDDDPPNHTREERFG